MSLLDVLLATMADVDDAANGCRELRAKRDAKMKRKIVVVVQGRSKVVSVVVVERFVVCVALRWHSWLRQ